MFVDSTLASFEENNSDPSPLETSERVYYFLSPHNPDSSQFHPLFLKNVC